MTKLNPEYLRPLDHMFEPDPRWSGFGSVTSSGKEALTLKKYAEPIQTIHLNNNAPEPVVVHFETAKNLALYAWHVYRFIPVAELHAFISIEFALREKTSNRKSPFKKLLQLAIDEGWLSNEKFTQWKKVTQKRAFQYEEDLKTAETFKAEPPTNPEYWNYLEVLKEYIPHFRNTYAHGSSSISPWPYSALVDSAEIINQLYSSD